MELTSVTLEWQKLLKKGKFPRSAEEIEQRGLNGPGVYLFIMRYPRTTVVYVGKAAILGTRIREHMANYLGFRYALREDDPMPGRKGQNIYWLSRPQDEGFNKFNNLTESLKKSAEEVARMEFHYCRCNVDAAPLHWDLSAPLLEMKASDVTSQLEAILIKYVRALEKEGPTPDHPVPITSDNFRCENPQLRLGLDQQVFVNWLRRTVATGYPRP